MIEHRLRRQLGKVVGRLQHVRLVWGWALIWILMAFVAAALLLLNRTGGLYVRQAPLILAGAALLVAVICLWFTVQVSRNYRRVAVRVESVYPELRTCLLAAIDQQPELPNERFGFLQDQVITQALQHAYGNPWTRVVPGWRLFSAHVIHCAALAGFIAVMAGLAAYARPPEIPWGTAPPTEITIQGTVEVTVEPGSTEVERGTSLVVLARVKGSLPAEVLLNYQGEGGEPQQLVMSKSLVDPVFGARMRDIQRPLDYHVEYDGKKTDMYHVSVFDYPALTRADARLEYPGYTGLDERLVQDVRHISAVEGTRLTMLCYLNKPVSSATLSDKTGATIELTRDSGDPTLHTTEIQLEESLRFELHLTDEQGRKNKRPPEFVVSVVPNQSPQLKLTLPRRDVQVSPLEELELKANAWDDYGLDRIGISYLMAEGKPQEVVLGESIAAKVRYEAEYLLAFEDLRAQPDQLLSYYFWAEDIGPNEKRRRTLSDMFFAEVRPFDEIFRQGRQPPSSSSQQQQQQQQQQQDGSAVEKLAELQKQIINATWKMFRRESMGELSEKFDDDAALVLDSQVAALDQAAALAQEVQEREMIAQVRKVLDRMSDAVDHLTKVRDLREVEPLQLALSAEQAAYQALLALRAREHEVRQSSSQRSQSSSSRSSPRSQQQLQQLQLESDRNRYETQRLAQSQEEQQDRETRQVLNRLRELARRQQDLNERLKELELALQEAQDEQQRKEVERQLKRLRDQQQELLRDADELMTRMESPENLDEMAESRQQMEQSRDNVRQASEALEEGKVSQAVTAGTRAQRELEQLRDDFRQRTSGRFQDEMRDLQQAATDLDETEQELSQRIAEMQDPQSGSRSLRDTGERERISEELGQQRQKLENVLEQMQETVLEAEETEPLLAERLYESFREAQQRQSGRSLDNASRSLDRGLFDDAQEQERIARDGIEQLRQGVDRAAESVLGDDTQALRLAHRTLEDLVEQLDDEMQRMGEASGSPSTDPQGRPRDQQGKPRPGQGEMPGEQPASDQDRAPQEKANPQAGSPNPSNQKPQSGTPGKPQPGTPGKPQPGTPGKPPPNGQPQPGGSPGQKPSTSSQAQPQAQPGANRPGNQTGRPGEPNSQRSANRSQSNPNGLGGFQQLLDDTGSEARRSYAPITGGDFREWSDRLRDVEEIVGDSELRSRAARIRDRAKSFRSDLRRHSQEPNWDLFRSRVAEPLVELRDRVAEELLRRSSKDALVPLDRDPVPPKYEEHVRRYYEQLGSGQ